MFVGFLEVRIWNHQVLRRSFGFWKINYAWLIIIKLITFVVFHLWFVMICIYFIKDVTQVKFFIYSLFTFFDLIQTFFQFVLSKEAATSTEKNLATWFILLDMINKDALASTKIHFFMIFMALVRRIVHMVH